MMVFIAKLFSPAVSPLMAVALLLIGGIVLFYRKPRIARAALISALAILLIAGNVWFSSLLAWLLEARTLPYAPLPDAQAIVVLSSDVHAAIAPQPSVTLDGATANRLLYTAQLYRRRLAPLVIVSGGRLQWLRNFPPMSKGMAQVLEDLGVPASAIVEESRSANTYQNAVEVRKILRQRRIGRILLVTSAMHMPRALALFKHQGIDAIAAPCDFTFFTSQDVSDPETWQGVLIGLIPTSSSMGASTTALKEFLGIALYRAAGLL